MESLKETKKTRLRQNRENAVYDQAMLYQILDESHIVQVGFSMDSQTYVIPMLGWRINNTLYIHGSNSSRMIKALTSGANCCVTATLLDGFVLAKSAFHHSANYRSAVIFGQFHTVDDPDAVNESLRLFTEQIAPGRWDEVRPGSPSELKATTVLAISLEEASVKVRTGGANDNKADQALPVWSGEMVFEQRIIEMRPDDYTSAKQPTPDYNKAWGDKWQVPR